MTLNNNEQSAQKFLLTLFLALFALAEAGAQEKFRISGYVSNLQSVMFQDFDANWLNEQILHNRLQAEWFPHKNISFRADLRSRLLTGDRVKMSGDYRNLLEKDPGFMPLNTNLINHRSIVLNTMADRLYLNFEKGPLNITLGRQRINWGRSIVWNPNDLFNSYSYFDFDYPEKPGADALRLQYYTGPSAKAEFSVKTDSSRKITAAGLYKFNIKNFDLQFIGGLIRESDLVAGAGFEGYLGNVSLRGEYSFILPRKHWADTAGLSVVSISADYLFPNSLSIQTEFLYNQQAPGYRINNFMQYSAQNLSVKNLSFTEYNVFAGITYPLTPLFTIGASAIWYPEIEGFFFGPNIDYSLAENLDFSLAVQSFSGDFLSDILIGGNPTNQLNIVFLRVKWNF